MGRVLSAEQYETEKLTWNERELKFDAQILSSADEHLKKFKNGDQLYLGSVTTEANDFTYDHWFVTDNKNVIEFGEPSKDWNTAKVTINPFNGSSNRYNVREKRKLKMCDVIRARMKSVLGVCNYSLGLRNSEHVASYIYYGNWISQQMSPDGKLMKYFAEDIKEKIEYVNCFPSNLLTLFTEDSEEPRLYSFLNPIFEVSMFQYYLKKQEVKDFTILVLGVTGAGKSQLINLLFNQRLCESRPGCISVTRDVYFLLGKETAREEGRKVIIADTIGLCDTDFTEFDAHKVIKQRVSSNCKHIDAVLIVFKNDRLQPDVKRSINKILNWLSYHEKNSSRFIFLVSNSDFLKPEQKEELQADLTKEFKLKLREIKDSETGEIFTNFIFIGFPADELDMTERLKEQGKKSYENIRRCLDLSDAGERIDGDRIDMSELSCWTKLFSLLDSL